jgi:organic radical activating enzyme
MFIFQAKQNVHPDMELLNIKLFEWLEENIKSLRKIIILGGEPFLQKETEKLIQFLEKLKILNWIL